VAGEDLGVADVARPGEAGAVEEGRRVGRGDPGAAVAGEAEVAGAAVAGEVAGGGVLPEGGIVPRGDGHGRGAEIGPVVIDLRREAEGGGPDALGGGGDDRGRPSRAEPP